MKANLLYGAAIWTFLSAAAFFSGCSDDDAYKDVDGQSPTLELTSDHVRTLTGYEFKIAGKITDKDGIRSIQLKCSELYLDKMIDLSSIYSEPLYEYDLNYGFTIPAKTEGDSFTVKVAVTDLGGRVSENNVLITMDGDYTKPELKSITPSGDASLVLSESTSLAVRFTATDDKGLDYVEVNIPDLEINDRQEADETTLLELKYNKNIDFPSDKSGTYKMLIRAVDLLGNVEEVERAVLVSKVQNYEKMYLVDFEGTDTKKLSSDIFGVPMLIERTDNFEYKACYYSKSENTPIRFLANKYSSSIPSNYNICFGDDKTRPGYLTNISDNIQPIYLPGKGYYEITFNTETDEYKVVAYNPRDKGDEPLEIGKELTIDGETFTFRIGLAGTGFKGMSWSTNQLLELVQDTDNPYLFTAECIAEDKGSFECTITPYDPFGNKWLEPYWRWDGTTSTGFASNVKNGGDNPKISVKAGTYIFEFDTHLLRSKLYPKE